ncbi:hypothetical protein [Ralstonia phage RSP15]|uniref:hypothetical protein n=1 Tax=Ralstonia phage RSP15 TaxID=1785960 RepID=UPI00074D3C4D|nr:hypothetical protein BH754_gp071 [Ralstonia phage RSP15]BAU40029.1 hypothetical protein [Ralstonia phage RSP15]
MADVATIAQNLSQQNAAKPAFTKEDVKELKASISDVFKQLSDKQKEMSAYDKKMKYAELKMLTAEMKKFPKEVFEDRDKYIKTTEDAVTQLEQSTSLIGKMQKDIKDKLLGSVPKIDSVFKGFLDNTSPFIKTGVGLTYGLFKYYKDWSKKAAETAEKAKANAEKLADNSTKSSKEVKEAVKDVEYQLTEAGKKLADERLKEKKARKGELGPVASRLDLIAKLTEQQNQILISLHDMFGVDGILIDDSRKKPEEPPAPKQTGKMSSDEETYALLTIDAIETQTKQIEILGTKLDDLIRQGELAIKESHEARMDAEKDRLQQASKKEVKPAFLGYGAGKDGEKKDGGGMGHLLTEIFGNAIGSMLPRFLLPVLGGIFTKLNPVKMLGGLMGGLLGGAGSLAGTIGGKAGGVLKAAKGILSLGNVSKFLLGPVGTVLFGLWDGYKGWENAAQILGKDQDKLTVWDKVSAGIGGFVGGFAGIADSILGFFGIETDIKGFVTETVAKFVNELPGKVMGMLNGIFDFIYDSFTKLTDAFQSGDGFGDTIVKVFSALKDIVTDALKGYITAVVKSLPFGDKILDAVTGLFSDGPKTPTAADSMYANGGSAAQAPRAIADTNKEMDAIDRRIDEKKQRDAQANLVSTVQNNQNINNTTINNVPLNTKNEDTSWKARFGYASNIV